MAEKVVSCTNEVADLHAREVLSLRPRCTQGRAGRAIRGRIGWNGESVSALELPKKILTRTYHDDDHEYAESPNGHQCEWVDEIKGHSHRDKDQASGLPLIRILPIFQPLRRGTVGIVKPMASSIIQQNARGGGGGGGGG
jgi:hypothetical protein